MSSTKAKLNKGKNGILKAVFSRISMVFIMLAVQVFTLFAVFYWLGEYSAVWYTAFLLIGAVLVVYIINSESNPAFKLAWILPVLILPVFGAGLYLFLHLQIAPKWMDRRLNKLAEEEKPYMVQDQETMEALKQADGSAAHLAHYMSAINGFPIYRNTQAEYFPLGEDKYSRMLTELKKAKKFIFLEYFIVQEGKMWDSILDILVKKVKEGVEVRFMYDGMCSIMMLPYNYPKKIRGLGIKCKMFSPIKPALSTHQNNRDHRKILVIDGHTAFTGGVNLADEYINEKERFGHWKDTAIMLKGDAVKSFTMMFLQMWNMDEKKQEDYRKYLPDPRADMTGPGEGFVMPYGDSPMDNENAGEHVYFHFVNHAKRYVHIMTPYLIPDNEMLTCLKYTAKSGVEVIIIMPHIPDKPAAYWLARTYYPELLNAGVKIYEYTPGFVHAKVFVSDDEKAVVGTINLDYRSLYLHFECAAFLYRNPAVGQAEKDFQETLKKCSLVTLEECRHYSWFKRLCGRVLRLFAPLM